MPVDWDADKDVPVVEPSVEPAAHTLQRDDTPPKPQSKSTTDQSLHSRKVTIHSGSRRNQARAQPDIAQPDIEEAALASIHAADVMLSREKAERPRRDPDLISEPPECVSAANNYKKSRAEYPTAHRKRQCRHCKAAKKGVYFCREIQGHTAADFNASVPEIQPSQGRPSSKREAVEAEPMAEPVEEKSVEEETPSQQEPAPAQQESGANEPSTAIDAALPEAADQAAEANEAADEQARFEGTAALLALAMSHRKVDASVGAQQPDGSSAKDATAKLPQKPREARLKRHHKVFEEAPDAEDYLPEGEGEGEGEEAYLPEGEAPCARCRTAHRSKASCIARNHMELAELSSEYESEPEPPRARSRSIGPVKSCGRLNHKQGCQCHRHTSYTSMREMKNLKIRGTQRYKSSLKMANASYGQPAASGGGGQCNRRGHKPGCQCHRSSSYYKSGDSLMTTMTEKIQKQPRYRAVGGHQTANYELLDESVGYVPRVQKTARKEANMSGMTDAMQLWGVPAPSGVRWNAMLPREDEDEDGDATLGGTSKRQKLTARKVIASRRDYSDDVVGDDEDSPALEYHPSKVTRTTCNRRNHRPDCQCHLDASYTDRFPRKTGSKKKKRGESVTTTNLLEQDDEVYPEEWDEEEWSHGEAQTNKRARLDSDLLAQNRTKEWSCPRCKLSNRGTKCSNCSEQFDAEAQNESVKAAILAEKKKRLQRAQTAAQKVARQSIWLDDSARTEGTAVLLALAKAQAHERESSQTPTEEKPEEIVCVLQATLQCQRAKGMTQGAKWHLLEAETSWGIEENRYYCEGCKEWYENPASSGQRAYRKFCSKFGEVSLPQYVTTRASTSHFYCSCGLSEVNYTCGDFELLCQYCGTWQHGECEGLYSAAGLTEYACCRCSGHSKKSALYMVWLHAMSEFHFDKTPTAPMGSREDIRLICNVLLTSTWMRSQALRCAPQLVGATHQHLNAMYRTRALSVKPVPAARGAEDAFTPMEVWTMSRAKSVLAKRMVVEEEATATVKAFQHDKATAQQAPAAGSQTKRKVAVICPLPDAIHPSQATKRGALTTNDEAAKNHAASGKPRSQREHRLGTGTREQRERTIGTVKEIPGRYARAISAVDERAVGTAARTLPLDVSVQKAQRGASRGEDPPLGSKPIPDRHEGFQGGVLDKSGAPPHSGGEVGVRKKNSFLKGFFGGSIPKKNVLTTKMIPDACGWDEDPGEGVMTKEIVRLKVTT